METLEFTATKTVNYYLKPYGKFDIKWKTNQGHLPHILPFSEVRFNYEAEMPLTPEQDKAVIKFMKKHKTDVLVDNRGEYYTRVGNGFNKISHPKLHKYSSDETFRQLVDER